MKKQDLLNLLSEVKSGKVKIDNVIEQMSATRKMLMQQEDVSKISDLKDSKCYFVKSGKIFSLPLKKKRSDGRIAEFVPYYRTTKNA